MNTSGDPEREHTDLLLELHRLMSVDKGDTDEADEVRDRMDPSWYRMTHIQQDRIRGLSGDLYEVSEDGPKPAAMNSEERKTWGQDWKTAYEAGDWDKVLELLRRPPTGVSRLDIYLIRSRVWEKLGQPAVAAVFMQEAERLGIASMVGVEAAIGAA